jgi:uncharacterized protein (UPF0332 family)
MNPRRFLTLADQLVKQKGPAEFRAAIGRAYYAVYNVGSQFLARMGLPLVKGGSHVLLQTRLMNSGDVELIGIGSNLGRFHQRRNKADYDMNDLNSEDENKALTAVQDAEQMIAALDALPIYGQRWKHIQAAILKAGV